jgi:hypothetical protein
VHEDLGAEVEILEAGAVEDPVGVGVGEQGVDGGDRFGGIGEGLDEQAMRRQPALERAG